MPLNEASGYRRSNLTKEQRQQAEAAIYGLGSTAMQPALTFEEIERMRQIVMQYDAKEKPQEFDINNPPRKPYKYQAFPRMLFNHAEGTQKIVHNEQQMEAAFLAGWSTDPVPVELVDNSPELPPEAVLEAEVLDKLARTKKVSK